MDTQRVGGGGSIIVIVVDGGPPLNQRIVFAGAGIYTAKTRDIEPVLE